MLVMPVIPERTKLVRDEDVSWALELVFLAASLEKKLNRLLTMFWLAGYWLA